jgi:hypothetical protein
LPTFRRWCLHLLTWMQIVPQKRWQHHPKSYDATQYIYIYICPVSWSHGPLHLLLPTFLQHIRSSVLLTWR